MLKACYRWIHKSAFIKSLCDQIYLSLFLQLSILLRGSWWQMSSQQWKAVIVHILNKLAIPSEKFLLQC